MKNLIKPIIILMLVIATNFTVHATHIVGGDIAVKSLGGNNFEITLKFYRDCSPGSYIFDPTITLGIYVQNTNATAVTPTLSLLSSQQLQLGDTCYTPPNLCVEEGIYRATVNLPNNPNGYYISWHRCCRNSIINNIVNPGSSGYVFYTEIPDPALQNSTPTFSQYPDAYMCMGTNNMDNFSATDVDGDSLVYSLTTPLDCATNGICGTANAIPAPTPTPYTTIPWQTPYSATNILGDLAMAVNTNGIILTNPPTQGVFVFCVKVEEYRAGVKIGEIRRDVQYAVLACAITNVSLSGPNPICLGQTTTLNAVGGQNYLWNTGETTISITVQPTAVGTYTYSAVTTVNPNCHISADTAITVESQPTASFELRTTVSCTGTTTELVDLSENAVVWYWDFGDGTTSTEANPGHVFPANGTYPVSLLVGNSSSSCTDLHQENVTVATSSITITPANVFTPNGDGLNDCFQPFISGALVDPNADCFSMEIYDRWGIKIFESSGGFNVCWDGKTKSNTKAKDGTYYYIVRFIDTTYKGYVALLREHKK